MVIYSTVTIDSVEFQDPDGILNPVPLGPVGLNREINPINDINPDELAISEGDPPTTEPAFVIAIHALDPIVGRTPPRLPDGSEAPNPSQATSNIIGLQIRAAGSYDDIEVPIFLTPQVFPRLEEMSNTLQPGQTFPPNPDGDTDVAATLWYFVDGAPAPITVDGDPIQGTATIENLDQSGEFDPVSGDGESTDELTLEPS